MPAPGTCPHAAGGRFFVPDAMKALALALTFALATLLQAATLSLDTTNPATSDVAFRPMLPVQGASAEIGVTVHNAAETEVPATISVALADGTLLGTTTVTVPPHDSAEAALPWVPQDNGETALAIAVAAPDGEVVSATAVAPVISRPLYFPWFGGHHGSCRQLRYPNVVLATTEDIAYWRRRGALPCLWKGLDKTATAEEYAAELAKGLDDTQNDAAGIMIDEMGGYDDHEILAAPWFAGLRQYLHAHPAAFTAVWMCGSLREPYCNLARNVYRTDEGINLLMCEAYCNYQVAEFRAFRRMVYFDQRIEMARRQDVLMSTVMTLALVGHEDKFNVTPYELEDQLRYVRMNAPEMPGVGFFHGTPPTAGLAEFADELCRKYFLLPVLDVYPEDLQLESLDLHAGREAVVLAGFRNVGASDAKAARVCLWANDLLLLDTTLDLPAARANEVPRAVQLKAAFVPESPGFVQLRAEIHPADDRQTLLRGSATREIYIRP